MRLYLLYLQKMCHNHDVLPRVTRRANGRRTGKIGSGSVRHNSCRLWRRVNPQRPSRARRSHGSRLYRHVGVGRAHGRDRWLPGLRGNRRQLADRLAQVAYDGMAQQECRKRRTPTSPTWKPGFCISAPYLEAQFFEDWCEQMACWHFVGAHCCPSSVLTLRITGLKYRRCGRGYQGTIAGETAHILAKMAPAY